ncbi:hypothetical protein BDA99DRAFT_531991 [Phascolomyces articulosus]|uniref:Uncharacterized protein n=1 Tax=Phascolomyces articulosus TaxID=60185 RepID=A0AAD5KAJ6_9FUNG|nr:hypothetical protein BDA99DRAFT_531991 [Phascolomyces articulosus]
METQFKLSVKPLILFKLYKLNSYLCFQLRAIAYEQEFQVTLVIVTYTPNNTVGYLLTACRYTHIPMILKRRDNNGLRKVPETHPDYERYTKMIGHRVDFLHDFLMILPVILLIIFQPTQ